MNRIPAILLALAGVGGVCQAQYNTYVFEGEITSAPLPGSPGAVTNASPGDTFLHIFHTLSQPLITAWDDVYGEWGWYDDVVLAHEVIMGGQVFREISGSRISWEDDSSNRDGLTIGIGMGMVGIGATHQFDAQDDHPYNPEALEQTQLFGQFNLDAWGPGNIWTSSYHSIFRLPGSGGEQIRGRLRSVTVTTDTFPYEDLCSGDGGNGLGCTDCPCSNNAPSGTTGGCLNSLGNSARLTAAGFPSAANDTLEFGLDGATTNTFAFLSSSASIAPANAANPCFGLASGISSPSYDGLRCAVMDVRRHGLRVLDGSGSTQTGWGVATGPAAALIQQGGFVPGQTRYFQAIYREGVTAGCGTGLNTSQAVRVQILF